jgi:hypothetical protein
MAMYDDLDLVLSSDDSEIFQNGVYSGQVIPDVNVRIPSQKVVQATIATIAQPRTPSADRKKSSKRKPSVSAPTPSKATPVKKTKCQDLDVQSPNGIKPERASWNASIIEILIETRWSETGKSRFLGAKNESSESTVLGMAD